MIIFPWRHLRRRQVVLARAWAGVREEAARACARLRAIALARASKKFLLARRPN